MARINISISEDTLKKVDRYKELVNLTRSGLITEALESYFSELQSRILEEKKKKAIEGIIKIREKIGEDLKGWDSTKEIKKLRDSRWASLSKNG
ncbi:MAG: type II toxin-antitoxin system HicB family antitoxin [Actinobacteria bacterium]|nr:type II toxin-antitoxin system HicB family antitoxin [Actinomycetota bacterium]